MPPSDYNSTWFSKSFNEDYFQIYRATDDTADAEVDRLLKYLGVRKSGRRFLDVGCGWGRHAVRLTERGHQVTGVDLSSVMLDQAENLAKLRGIPHSRFDFAVPQHRIDFSAEQSGLNFARCDMRELHCHQQFDYAISIFTSFGYFSEKEDNLKVLRGMYDALKIGGKIVIDIDNPQQYVRRDVRSDWLTITDQDGNAREVTKDSDYDDERGRRVVRYFVRDEPTKPIYLECQLYDRSALTDALTSVGFTIEKLAYGDWHGQKYDHRLSKRLILIGTRT